MQEFVLLSLVVYSFQHRIDLSTDVNNLHSLLKNGLDVKQLFCVIEFVKMDRSKSLRRCLFRYLFDYKNNSSSLCCTKVN